jgi:hypothetical protein
MRGYILPQYRVGPVMLLLLGLYFFRRVGHTLKMLARIAYRHDPNDDDQENEQ